MTRWVLIYIFSFQLNICIPVRIDRKCKNNTDTFYYIWGNVVLPDSQAKITDFVKNAHPDYFWVKSELQDKPFVLYICSKTFGELKGLEEW